MKASTLLAFVAAFAAAVSGVALASGGADIRMEPAQINRLDLASQQRGARTFVNYCLNCHTAKYMRYNRLTDLGLTEAQIRDNLMFATDKIGETMNIAMRPADAKAWFGVAPPDLTVESRVRGVEWLYNYFLAFYKDDTAPSGWNNLVFPNVAMPHVLAELGGTNRLVTKQYKDHDEAQGAALAAKGIVVLGPGKDRTFVVQTIAVDSPGTLSPIEYQRMVADLVNFLDYMGEPAQEPADENRAGRAPLSGRAAVLRLLAEARVLEGRSLKGRAATRSETPLDPRFFRMSPLHTGPDAPKPRGAHKPREENLPMMTLYSGTTDPFSQRCRIVLHEKGMDFQIIDVDLDHKPEDLAVMNPYNQVPVLVERDLVLHESNIINEYIDERFPHPQLMPADPVMRARARLFLHRFEKELFCHIDALEGNNQKQLEKARGHVRDSLMQIAPVFAKHKHMLGEEYSMLDVAITPLLWRLDYYGIQMPKQAVPLLKYAERLFARPAFSEAMTSAERGMRK